MTVIMSWSPAAGGGAIPGSISSSEVIAGSVWSHVKHGQECFEEWGGVGVEWLDLSEPTCSGC